MSAYALAFRRHQDELVRRARLLAECRGDQEKIHALLLQFQSEERAQVAAELRRNDG